MGNKHKRSRLRKLQTDRHQTLTKGRRKTLGKKNVNNKYSIGPKATQVISIGLGRTMERKRNSEHLKKTAPEAEVLLKR
ncbi:hypothetical protein MTR_5g065315 [Medicago truncatula]|uniref:Uncharacterized protein n=1 Tax=Medicago truncatula TaxID=3880 RepID=A0A072UEK6_MEDTR|nr:hypothetical protein MTR_5g065315 [Medicago truncatula]